MDRKSLQTILQKKDLGFAILPLPPEMDKDHLKNKILDNFMITYQQPVKSFLPELIQSAFGEGKIGGHLIDVWLYMYFLECQTKSWLIFSEGGKNTPERKKNMGICHTSMNITTWGVRGWFLL